MRLVAKPNSNDILPSAFKSLLQEFSDMFPHEDASTGLPSIRGIKHQIDFILEATLPNIESIEPIQPRSKRFRGK